MNLLGFPFLSRRDVPRQRQANRRCILHVGSPKTGTTSIQSMLRLNRNQLARQGILVPQSGQGRSGSHRALVHELGGWPTDPKDSVEQKFAREVLECRADTILISSEFMWPLLCVPARAERLLGRIRSLGFDIVLAFYVRNQPQYLNSSYVQNVKTLLRNNEFPEFAGRALSNQKKYSYSHWIAFAAKHKLEMLPRPFSEAVRKTGVTEDFLATIGVTSTRGFDTAIERNVSLGPFSVELARSLLRRVGGPKALSPSQADQCRSAFRAELSTRRIEDRGYCGLTTSFAAEVEARFAEDNDRFARFAWGKSWREVFATDLGRSFEPNDYSVTGIPADRRELMGEVLDSLGARFDAIVSAPEKNGARLKPWRVSSAKSRAAL